MVEKTTRRNFLITSVAVAGGVVGASSLQKETSNAAKSITTIPERVLGRTGVKVPILGLGGAGTKTPLDKEDREGDALAIIQRALELGIRYFDTAASYGTNEIYLGKVLPAHRSNIFLASKTYEKERDGAWRELERSLKRLNTDYLNLWQLHSVAVPEHVETIFGANGAIKALEEAKEQKIVRYVGITGHHEPDVIIEAMRRYPFHTTLIPVNAADKHHPRPYIPSVLPLARQQNVGVIAMKVPAYGKLFQSDGLTGMQQAMSYALSQSGVHCCIVSTDDVQQLEENVRVARAFEQLSNNQLVAIENRTAKIWQDSTFYRAWG
ncbi:aldo/keto reductase [Aliterella atlantica]|uniref:Aldo/keto reductase n=1 Tax=Aliterella atlantica CENA595 TaxID=1618023 RepID=A0A0D9A0R4_9CYAN|nr:aldo/keto reductase [Aliterella atlantica]KJH73071.1 aldo/keto reductase [Aliterella atlantica CENA595]